MVLLGFAIRICSLRRQRLFSNQFSGIELERVANGQLLSPDAS